MPSDRSVAYNNFRAGEWGSLGADKPPQGSFHGTNVLVYANGLLGPRPGLKDLTPASMPNGLLRFFVETPTPDREGLFAIGNTAYYSSFRDVSITPTALTGDEMTGLGYAVLPKPDTATYLVAVPDTVPGDLTGGIYRLDVVAGTLTRIATHSANELELYDSQLVTNQNTADGPRLFGSEPIDFTAFPHFIDIGDNWGVNAIRQQRNHLTILKRNGIYLMTGVFGDNTMVVRKASNMITAWRAWQADVDNDDRIWFIPGDREYPVGFNGSTITPYAHLNGLSPRVDDDGNLPLKRGIACFGGQLTNSAIIAVQAGGPNRAVLQQNGIWTYHHFETPVSGIVRGFGDHFITTDGGAADAPARLFMGVSNLDRPSFINDPRSSPGDGSSTPLQTEVELPIWLDDRGDEVRVRAVTIELKKWNTGVATNQLDVLVRTINRPNGYGNVDNAVRQWTEAGSAASTDGSHDRIVLPMHCAIGQGFQIKLSNLVGVAIRSVTVDLDDFKPQPRKD